MSLQELNVLIAEATNLAGGSTCAAGCDWQMDGARRCPHGADSCSQAAYQCSRCGAFDYGDAGGPGAQDCAGGACSTEAQRRFRVLSRWASRRHRAARA